MVGYKYCPVNHIVYIHLNFRVIYTKLGIIKVISSGTVVSATSAEL